MERTLWLCHRGYISEENEAFDIEGLELLDVETEACGKVAPGKRKRVPGKCESKELRALALEFPKAFAAVVATARWKAEELSSHRQGRPDRAEPSKSNCIPGHEIRSKTKASSSTPGIRKEAATEGMAEVITMDSLQHAAITSARRRREQLVAGTGRSCPMALQCKFLGIKQASHGGSCGAIPKAIRPDTSEAVFQWKVSAPGSTTMTGTVTAKCCDAVGETGVVGLPNSWFKQLHRSCRELAENKYSLRYMEAIGAASAVRHYEEVRLATGHRAAAVLSCKLKPPSDNKPIKQATKIEFEWEAGLGSAVEVASTIVRVDNVLGRGVPLPEGWHTQLTATALPALAEEATKQMHARDPNLRSYCQQLGVPKAVPLPPASWRLIPGGKIVARRSDGCHPPPCWGIIDCITNWP